MAECLKFSNDFTSESGQTYKVLFGDFYDLETCLNVPDGQVLMTSQEYIQLKADSDAVQSIMDASAFVDPVEVSAVYGTSFALIFAISAIAYKIKVAKRAVKLA